MVKESYKTHYRHSSMEVKFNDKPTNNASHNSNASTSTINKDRSPGTSVNPTKNIHAMKEMLYPHNSITNTTNKSTSKNPKPKANSRQPNNSSSNIIVNQGGNPCFNHITIYTSNNPTNLKPNDINLRQYIFNKVSSKPKSLSKLGHPRSVSTNMH